MAPDQIIAARAAALFASGLSSRCQPSDAALAAAIRTAITACGGIRGCLGEVAAAYGEHPETAVPRMRWARQTVDAIYSSTATSVMAAIATPESVLDIDEAEEREALSAWSANSDGEDVR